MIRRMLLTAGAMILALGLGVAQAQQAGNGYGAPARVQPVVAPAEKGLKGDTFSVDEIVDVGHKFFGTTTRGLARAVESVFRKRGRPTGYVLGEEASGAFVAGLRYGEGWLYMKDGRRQKIFWQGPSIGLDAGGEGAKVLMLVYDITTPRAIFGRLPGLSGSAYLVAGFGVSAYGNEQVTLVPVRSGVGWRLGANMGYLKITPRPTWNPF